MSAHSAEEKRAANWAVVYGRDGFASKCSKEEFFLLVGSFEGKIIEYSKKSDAVGSAGEAHEGEGPRSRPREID